MYVMKMEQGRWESFFDLYTSKTTIRVYKWALKTFFKCIYGKSLSPEKASEKYFAEERDYESDVKKFFVEIKGKAPMTVDTMLKAVRVFLMENDVELKQKFWRRLRGRRKGSRALTLDKVPSNKQLRRILTHMPIHGKALYLALSSSGMRIGEALKIRLEDVEWNAEPLTINIRGENTKTGNPRITFVSSEAKEALEEWLKLREDYISTAVKKSHLYRINKEDDRLFPFLSNTAYMIWKNALDKTKLNGRDVSTNRHKLHPHVLRKFFRTKMGSIIPIDVAEALMGHEGYLTQVYRKYSVEDLAKFYRQGESALAVFTELGEISKLKEEVQERNKQLQTLVNGLATENVSVREKMKNIETEFEQLQKRMARYEAHVKRWMGMTVEERDEYDKGFWKKRQERILKEDRETYAEEQELPEEA